MPENMKKNEEICQQVIDEHPQLVERYNNGMKGLLGALMAEAFKKAEAGGDPNPREYGLILAKLIAEARVKSLEKEIQDMKISLYG